jgi:hypothetical protein
VRTHRFVVVAQTERIAVNAYFRPDLPISFAPCSDSPIPVLVEPDASVRSTLRTHHSTARAF